MIRTLFWILLLANISLFAWVRWAQPFLNQTPESAIQPPLNADQIRLLGFSAAPASANIPVSAPVVVATPEIHEPPTSQSAPSSAPVVSQQVQSACLEWGEFSGTDLASATQDLASLSLGDNLAQREVEHAIGYWVYIPPLKSHADVKEKLAQLKKRGVTEHFVVQEKGKWQNTISLGVFKTQDTAARFLALLKSKGIKSAVMGERQTRLKFTVFVLRDPDQATLAKLAEWQNDFTDINMKTAPCP